MRQTFIAFAERHGRNENVSRPNCIRIEGAGRDGGKIRRELRINFAAGPESGCDG